MRYDVIIIGAGMSGIAAGIRLAHFDKKVCILERHDRVGGLNSYYRAGGYNLDVGLHAVTNFSSKSSFGKPLKKIFRQLRIKPEDFGLAPQIKSRIAFPETSLDFTNDFGYFESQVQSRFPDQKENFRKLVAAVKNTDEFDYSSPRLSSRKALAEIITDPLLTEMILCPLMFYGNADEDDMEFRQFVIMFKSIFMEGFARPFEGVRKIIDRLMERYEESHGELRLEAGVAEIMVENGRVSGVALQDGSVLECDMLLSSIGSFETASICRELRAKGKVPRKGRMSFMESINIYGEPLPGERLSIVFYSRSNKFVYRKPQEPVDVSTGVICFPDNFDYGRELGSRMVRITNSANFDFWEKTSDYAAKKREWHQRSLETVSKIVRLPDSKPKFYDAFTPSTIKRYTGHENGAVYGSPDKAWNGATSLPNLFLCGTDQGFVGIVGTLLSGISITNQYLLK